MKIIISIIVIITLIASACIYVIFNRMSLIERAVIFEEKQVNSIKNMINVGINYIGAWNASNNTPVLLSGIGTRGNYYKVSVSGVTEIDGINSWHVGDWIIFNGTSWDKVDNTETVSSVNKKIGDVTLTKTDVGLDNVDNTSDINKPLSNSSRVALNTKQDILVSGSNIKTLNGTSLLGSGNIEIDQTSLGLGSLALWLSLQTIAKQEFLSLPVTSISMIQDYGSSSKPSIIPSRRVYLIDGDWVSNIYLPAVNAYQYGSILYFDTRSTINLTVKDKNNNQYTIYSGNIGMFYTDLNNWYYIGQVPYSYLN